MNRESKENIKNVKEEILEEIKDVIKEENTDNVDLLDELDTGGISIAKLSFANKNKVDLIIKTAILISIWIFESYAIFSPGNENMIMDIALFILFISYFIYRLISQKKSVRLFLELPIIIPIFLLYPYLDAGIDFIRLLMIISISIDYILDYILDLVLHKQILLICIIWIFVLYVGTIGFMRFENMNFSDSFWLVWVTSTTVGYGDYFAVTLYGRLVTIFLMLGGIAIVSALTAFILDYIQSHTNNRAKEIMDEINKEKES